MHQTAMWIFITFSIFVGINGISNVRAEDCDLTLQKDGNILEDGEHVLGIGGELNQIYCKALCSGTGSPPALKWYKKDVKRPIRAFSGRVYQVRTTFRRVSILTITNLLYNDSAIYTCKGWIQNKGWIEKSFELVYGCKGSGYVCDTSKCISQSQICDGNFDCKDGTDEEQCETCGKTQFHCNDGQCIPEQQKCDGYRDCVDGSDEYECGCGPDFTCSYGMCLAREKVCDTIYDCLIGEDEANCTYCKEDEFHCGALVCISNDLVCDGKSDCPDRSEELKCPLKVEIDHASQEVDEGDSLRYTCTAVQSFKGKPYKLTWSRENGELSKKAFASNGMLQIQDVEISDAGIYICTGSDGMTTDEAFAELIVNERCGDGFMCSNGTCVPEDLICDLVPDCPNEEDEIGCIYCADDEYHCGNSECIKSEKICDGIVDCSQGTDEIDCCVGQYECWDGTCLETDAECNGIKECATGEDEENCTYCAIDEFHCGLGVCIKDTEICDGIAQCTDSSDEQGCEICEAYQIQCEDGSCLNSTYICDHVLDCPLGDDEVNCTCFTDSFVCGDGQCVNQSAVCNGVLECQNGADEEGCPATCNPEIEFTCKSNGKCIPLEWRCDGSADCNDGSDECGCAEIEFTCNNGMCINDNRRCDGVPDCEGEEDEKNCSKVCPESTFLCNDQSACITTFQLCDMNQDCDDNSDETDCDSHGDTTTNPVTPKKSTETYYYYDEYTDEDVEEE